MIIQPTVEAMAPQDTTPDEVKNGLLSLALEISIATETGWWWATYPSGNAYSAGGTIPCLQGGSSHIKCAILPSTNWSSSVCATNLSPASFYHKPNLVSGCLVPPCRETLPSLWSLGPGLAVNSTNPLSSLSKNQYTPTMVFIYIPSLKPMTSPFPCSRADWAVRHVS